MMFLRKGMSLLLALTLLFGVFSAACPLSAKADEADLNYVEFSYKGRSYLLPVGSQVRFSDIYSSLGLSGSLQSMQVSNNLLLGVPPSSAWMDFVPHDDDDDNWWAESYRQLPSEQWVEVSLDGTWYKITLTPSSGSLISGILVSSDEDVYFGGIRWRVLDKGIDQWLLISAEVLGDNMNWDQAIGYCSTVYNSFSSVQKGAVASTTKTDVAYGVFDASNLDEARLFLLSAHEALTYFNSDSDRKPEGWWLRSLHKEGDTWACVVDEGGILRSNLANSGNFGARPVFHLNLSSVLFTSTAEGDKSSAAAGGGKFGKSDGSGLLKFTLKDSSRDGFAARTSGSAALPGGRLAVTYSGANTGTDEYVSAMICDASGAAQYYASLTPDSSGSGTWNMTIPGELADGTYTLKVFSEQRNGYDQTDYASAFVSLPLTVVRFSGSGTTADPWQIGSAADWNRLSAAVENGLDTAGQHFRLTDDISVSTMVGTSANPFAGHFDGAGHTLTIDYTATETFCAPFRYVDGAAIENLTVTGAITTDYISAAGFVGNAASCTITNCVSNVDIISNVTSANEHGGFVATATNTRIEGCVYNGSITGNNPRYCAGFLNRGDNSCLCVNCIFAPDSFPTNNCANFCRWGSAGNNCYYFTFLDSGRDTGKQAYFVQGGNGVMLDFGTPKATYPTSGIMAYDTGIQYNGVFYAGEGQTVTLGLSGADTYAASAGSLTNADGVWTLTLPDGDVVISAVLSYAFGTPDFTLPAFLTTVGEEAFEGIAARVVDVPASCTSIGDRAFRSCPNLTQIRIPANCSLGVDVFDGCAMVVVFGAVDSPAESYCSTHANCVFVAEK